MSELLNQAKRNRKFIAKDLTVKAWEDVEPYFKNLLDRDLNSTTDLEIWLRDRSELDAVLEEDMAWRYIRMNCNTEDATLAEDFNFFVSTIEPEANKLSNLLDEKFTSCSCFNDLDNQKYFILIRSTRNKMELYKEENLRLNAELQQESQEYGVICSKQMIEHQGKEYTLQQASVFLKDPNRELREQIYRKISERRVKDAAELDDLLTRLIIKRHEVATNANFDTYTAFRFKELCRFDYTQEDCLEFQESVKTHVMPIVKRLNKARQEKLGYVHLRPWDLEVDVEGKNTLKPFTNTGDLLDKTIACFNEIDKQFGDFLVIMKENKYLDLDSRKAKAPGGFNYPLYESNAPFIYMNAAGTLRDVETMVHEGGHAIHSFLSAKLELVEFKGLPSEVAELASMSMELISMEHWHHFFEDAEQLKRAKKQQLEGVISILPWVMIIDKFQNFLYNNHQHSLEDRKNAWNKILSEFSDNAVDWKGLEYFRGYSWQKQLHVFEVPFYYIEYAISQLGAISIWKNYKDNPAKTIQQYKDALSLGYTVPIAEIYETAGIKFDFSSEYVNALMTFVSSELDSL